MSRTPGAAGGPEQRTGSNLGTALPVRPHGLTVRSVSAASEQREDALASRPEGGAALACYLTSGVSDQGFCRFVRRVAVREYGLRVIMCLAKGQMIATKAVMDSLLEKMPLMSSRWPCCRGSGWISAPA